MASLADLIDQNTIVNLREDEGSDIQGRDTLPNVNLPSPFLSNGQRLTLGIVVLFLVDVIWVASSELSEYIFHDEKYNKPFFSTYLKTSMFLLFLLGFLFWTPWQDRCLNNYYPHSYSTFLLKSLNSVIFLRHGLSSSDTRNSVRESPTYPKMENSNLRNYSNSHKLNLAFLMPLASEPQGRDGISEQIDVVDDNANESPLSAPSYVPINYEPNSGNESDDSAQHRSVRFNKVAEVRHLSDSQAADAVFARLSYQATVHAEQMAQRIASRLGPGETAKLAMMFCILWFLANYSYQLAISNTEAGIVNVLSSSSSLFTLLMAAIFPSVAADKFTLSKLLAVLVSFSGVVVVSFSDLTIEKATVPLGAIFALISAFFYASYLVFLRKRVDHEDKLDIPMFFGFVGLFNLIILWPTFFVLNYSAIETFELPTKRQWLFLILNGIIGTVFSEVLWLWGCFLTSSLIATLAISLTIPLSMVADVLLKRISYSTLFYIGTIPMILSFFVVTTLSHYDGWDPVMDFLKILKKALRCRRNEGRYNRILINDVEQREYLIGINYDNEDHEDNDNDDSDSDLHILGSSNSNEPV